MKEFGTWFLASAALALGLSIAWIANQNHACAELGARFVRQNGDLDRELARLELELAENRSELERCVLEGRPLPYEIERAAAVQQVAEVRP